MLALDGITKVTTIHPEGMNYREGMNVYTKFHCNPSNNGWDILLKKTKVNLMVAQKEKS